MEAQIISIKKIRRHPKRPHVTRDVVVKIAQSIEEFGWLQPIVIDANYTVITGDTRLRAARKLGMKKVPVLIAAHLFPAETNYLRESQLRKIV